MSYSPLISLKACLARRKGISTCQGYRAQIKEIRRKRASSLNRRLILISCYRRRTEATRWDPGTNGQPKLGKGFRKLSRWDCLRYRKWQYIDKGRACSIGWWSWPHYYWTWFHYGGDYFSKDCPFTRDWLLYNFNIQVLSFFFSSFTSIPSTGTTSRPRQSE